MIISKTPVRVSFFGGGTDYPDYYKEFGGSVLSTSIDKYIYITVSQISGLLDHKYRIAYSKLELCNNLNEIEHPVVREVIRHIGIESGLEINIISDLPARTGIGSSSSFTVGLLHALYAMKGVMKGKKELALEAIYIEQIILGERVGVQDQLAAAIGGFNIMKFSDQDLQVNPLLVSENRRKELEGNLLMFYTGVNRFASEILKEQIEKTQEKKIIKELTDIHNMVNKGVEIMSSSGINLDEFGKLMHEAWMKKRSLSSSISNDFLDGMYDTAIHSGAIGGKLLGAGGGGFFVFYVPKEKQEKVKESLKHLHYIDFSFENEGASIVYYNN